MSEHEKTAIETLLTVMDEKYNQLLKVVYGLVIVIIGAGAIQFVTFGELKSDVKNNIARTDYIWKEFVPTMFLEGFAQNQNYQTQEIVATLTGDKAKVKEINDKYIEFQKTMINNLIQMRGGMSNTTRSIKQSSQNGGTGATQ